MHSRSLLLALLTLIGLPSLASAQPESKPGKKPQTTPRVALAVGPGGKWGGRWAGRRRLARFRPVQAQAIKEGLEWLSKHQDQDGCWNAAAFMRHDKQGKKSDSPGEFIGRVGITAFCLLSFLGDLQTPHRGPYRRNVRRAVLWLKRRQYESGGYSNQVLEHALATYAMCEACGLSSPRLLRDGVRSALEHLVDRQNDDGGWSHMSKGKPSGAFRTCHAILAYKSGLDFRIVSDTSPLKKAATWLNHVTGEDGSVSAPDSCLLTAGTRHKETAAASGLVSRFFLGYAKTPVMVEASRLLAAHPPTDDKAGGDPVFAYVAAYGLYQMGGGAWQGWSAGMESIATAQRDDGNFKGSWDPVGKGVVRGGRLYATVLSVLTLETHYRYTRLVR